MTGNNGIGRQTSYQKRPGTTPPPKKTLSQISYSPKPLKISSISEIKSDSSSILNLKLIKTSFFNGQIRLLLRRNSRIILLSLFRLTDPPTLREIEIPNLEVSPVDSAIYTARLRPLILRESLSLKSRKISDRPFNRADLGNLRLISGAPDIVSPLRTIRQKRSV